MATTPVADFTPAEVDLIVRRGSWTPIAFVFTSLDLTGYTAPTFRWAANVDAAPTELTADIAPSSTTSTLTVTLDTDAWATLTTDRAAIYELTATSPTGQPVALASGRLSIEDGYL